MTILLDTHTILWFLENNPKLPTTTRNRIETTPTVFVSIVSLWEICIKANISKLNLSIPFAFPSFPSLSFFHFLSFPLPSLFTRYFPPFFSFNLSFNIDVGKKIIPKRSSMVVYGRLRPFINSESPNC